MNNQLLKYNSMEIKQFYDEALSHASYAVWEGKEMVLIDPSRDPLPYYRHAEACGAEITHVLETHPHADFVSCHLQVHQEKGATILVNPMVEPGYPFSPFNDGDELKLGKSMIRALHTPGHSPDSNSYLLLDAAGKSVALFTGDFLFINDVGRPDLREGAGRMREERMALARRMYQSIHQVLAKLPDDVMIYPAHGAGSLCGKNLSDQLSDTLGNQRTQNWALQEMSEEDFVKELLKDQPYVPYYFPFDVEVNRTGAASVPAAMEGIGLLTAADVPEGLTVVDTRPEASFKQGHLPGAINIQCGPKDKYETWLGSIVKPGEQFCIVVAEEATKTEVLARTARIGYETFVTGVVAGNDFAVTDIAKPVITAHPDESGAYYILDIRQAGEHVAQPLFTTSVNIPLVELKERAKDISTDKPVLVHCAGGYRSAIGASLLKKIRPDLKVFDLSTEISRYK